MVARELMVALLGALDHTRQVLDAVPQLDEPHGDLVEVGKAGR
jgi:hypothetical protein